MPGMWFEPLLGRRCETQLDRGIPALTLQRLRIDQPQTVGAEGERGGHREHRQCRACQGGADRHGGAPAAGSGAIRTPAATVTGRPVLPARRAVDAVCGRPWRPPLAAPA